MWKSGWKIEKKWIQGKERWLVLLAGGLILLLLAVPSGWEGRETAASISPNVRNPSAASRDREVKGQEDAVHSQALAEAPQSDGSGYQEAALLASSGTDTQQLYEKEMEKRITELLKHVEGVGEVDVMITLRSSGEKVIHVDQDRSRSSTEEKDSSGGTRKLLTEEIRETSLMAGGTGAQEPVIEKELEPEIAGIVVSAQGGGSAAVRAEISEAMEALFGLPAHKIKVLKRVE